MNQQEVTGIQGDVNPGKLPEILDRQNLDQDTEILDGLDWEIPCDTTDNRCRENGPHRADWVVAFSCGHSKHWCNLRFLHYRSDLVHHPEDALWCAACGSPHEVQVTLIAWWPIRLSS